jgi:hypothetical protein
MHVQLSPLLLLLLCTEHPCRSAQGIGRVTSYAASSGAGAATGPGSAADSSSSRANSSSGVLNNLERAALAVHPGLADLVEFMLVGNPTWRPGAPEVVIKTQMLLASVDASLV